MHRQISKPAHAARLPQLAKLERLTFCLASVQIPKHGGAHGTVAGFLSGAGAAAGMGSSLSEQGHSPEAVPAAGDESESCHINTLAA